MSYFISQVSFSDRRAIAQINGLLEQEGIRLDSNLDYICCMYDTDYNPIATGSCFGNTLRCFAVDHTHQGEGLMNQIVTHLMEVQFARGNTHIFVYTKCQSTKFFIDLGFYEIARVEDTLVFLENKKNGFLRYLTGLQRDEGKKSAAVVMNANPFTLGHQYLAEKAAADNECVHLFVVSEDASLVPFAVRKQLVEAGTAHLSNVILHESGPYIISNATFPSYFLTDEKSVIEGQARLDLAVFSRIAKELNITRRYVGEEPTSIVTGLYNQIMEKRLPEYGIECIIIPRLKYNGVAISASTVRECLQQGDWDRLSGFVPDTTLSFFRSPEAVPVLERIRQSTNVIHY